MKRILIYSFLLLSGYLVLAQQKGYRIEGDEVVFTFDRKDYALAREDGFGEEVGFDDLDINSVAVAGEFNNWSYYQWKMIKVDKDRYELRKKLSNFDHQFSWEFKYVINNFFWAEPRKTDANVTRAFKDGYPLPVYNLMMYTARPDENGNATFRLRGHPNAEKVILAGSFNKWDEHVFQMQKKEGYWELSLQLLPGEYEYKFIIDGEWTEDMDNPYKVLNEFGGYNSVIQITRKVPFFLRGFPDAQRVTLSGSFNDWATEGHDMLRTSNGWVDTLALVGGKHHYKFIVDGEWMVDPENSVKEYDGKGNINSVCMVR
ncbi:hypothetical protein L0P88_12035 [Muricauda sp. SCSIO 64092]|uniref:hypothetical protein n=1 Tax=Allomuricauda sp. SCSIO 64092 TaxID=2908842 RepID=UPI001FF1E8BD|nr:hypothetical protein [Muricauda sp. SCSIO 64092]UOY09242.1 hypothetical protein L0P88_12035 [Muricauda sp. SCSIO 64092]